MPSSRSAVLLLVEGLFVPLLFGAPAIAGDLRVAGGEHGPDFGTDGEPHPDLPKVFDETVAWLDAHLKRVPVSANTRQNSQETGR